MTAASRKRRVKKQSNISKFNCGCRIKKGKITGAFEIAPCDYHVSRLDTTSLSLPDIVNKIQQDQT